MIAKLLVFFVTVAIATGVPVGASPISKGGGHELQGAGAKDSREHTVKLPEKAADLIINLPMGAVVVKSEGRDDAHIVVTRSARGETDELAQQAVQQMKVSVIKRPKGVEIQGERYEAIPGTSDLQLSVRVEVPPHTRASIDCGMGSVSLCGPLADIEASVGSGALNVRNAGGPCRLQSGQGAVEIEGVSAPIDLKAGQGATVLRVRRRDSLKLKAELGQGMLLADRPFTISHDGLLRETAEGTWGGGKNPVNISHGQGRLEIRLIN